MGRMLTFMEIGDVSCLFVFWKGFKSIRIRKKNDFSYVCARTEYANHIINKLDLRKCFTCIGKIINFDFNNTCNRQKHWFKYVMVKSVSKTETRYNLEKIPKSTKHRDSFFCVEKITRELSFNHHTQNHHCSKFCF